MGKKKNMNSIDEETNDYINSKMAPKFYGNNISNYKGNFLEFKADVKCKNIRQKEFYLKLKDGNNTINFGFGSAGTGKSMISIWYALEEISKNDKYKKIIIFVPTCEASKTLSLGFLKGTLEEKTEVYKASDKNTIIKILNLNGNLNSEYILEKLLEKNIIEFEFLNFCKGKTYDNSIILVNEAEDFSQDDMLLLLTRIGENSKIIITGDERQVSRSDLKNKNKSGLLYAIEKLENMEEVSTTYFSDDDIVRNKLITKILKNWY